MNAIQGDSSCPASVPRFFKFYDEGWNAYLRGEPFDHTATPDWKDGWRDCQECPSAERAFV